MAQKRGVKERIWVGSDRVEFRKQAKSCKEEGRAKDRLGVSKFRVMANFFPLSSFSFLFVPFRSLSFFLYFFKSKLKEIAIRSRIFLLFS